MAEEIIRELSDLIHFTFGSEQIVGRFYADELVIFLRVPYSAGELLALAEKICRQMNKPFMFSEAQLRYPFLPAPRMASGGRRISERCTNGPG